ncbi:MAG: hypothetical protein AB7U34_05445, partial [Novosphingobium sp.]
MSAGSRLPARSQSLLLFDNVRAAQFFLIVLWLSLKRVDGLSAAAPPHVCTHSPFGVGVCDFGDAG